MADRKRKKKRPHRVKIEGPEPPQLDAAPDDAPANAKAESDAPGEVQEPYEPECAEQADEVPEDTDWQERYEQEHDRHLRAVAELRNYQRRVARERAETIQYANSRLWEALLPIVDDLQRALDAAKTTADAAALAQGVQLILEGLRGTMADFGVAPIPAAGETFDPRVHEAVERVDTTEHDEGAVVEEVLPGYKLHDRVLRPAKVQVAVKPAPKAGNAAD